MINEYENEIKKKDEDIAKYKKYIEDSEKKASQDEKDKIIKEYENKYNLEKEKTETLKKQLYDYYKYLNDLELEKNKTTSLQKDINDLKDKYTDLEKRYNEKTMTAEERKKIENELKVTLEEKYKLEKEKEVQNERAKIKKEFDLELEQMKKNLTADKYNNDSLKIDSKDQYFAIITDIINDVIAFQSIIINSNLRVNVQDVVQVVRLKDEGGIKKVNIVGSIKITWISNNSLYGRGQINYREAGYNIQISDLLKK